MSTPQAISSVKQALVEKLHQEIVPELEELIEQLPEQLLDFQEAELRLRQGLLQVAQHLLEKWADVADLSVERPRCPGCGVPMRHKGRLPGSMVTTLGEVAYRRPRWRCQDCGQECYPHDAVLCFLKHRVSWALAKVVSRMACQLGSFEEARDTLQDDYGIHLAKETIRDVSEAAGQQVLQQEDELRRRIQERQAPLPESTQMPAKACVFADGTTVHSEGDWHEIRVTTVTTEDALGRPLARQSRARFLPVDEVGWVLLLLAREVGYANAPLRAFIADGAQWLWRLAEQYFGSAVQILDWYHLAEHVHKAGNGLWGEGSAAAQQWCQRLKDELWEGRGSIVLELVRTEWAKVRSPDKRALLAELETYLEHNLARIDYPRYRELGLPVGSGEVEAQCKTLVGARCKQAGMRNWTYAGAEAVLRLRAAKQDGSFNALWKRELRLAA
jgi:transposase